jgi:hypothetical protein
LNQWQTDGLSGCGSEEEQCKGEKMLAKKSKFVLVALVFVQGLVLGNAFAGSIVINAADPDSALKYQDDAGTTKVLSVSWSDIQLVSKVNAYLLKNQSGRDLPYMIDRASQTVSILVNRSAGTYQKISFSDLKDF